MMASFLLRVGFEHDVNQTAKKSDKKRNNEHEKTP
jgi:hypothetical protein